MPTGRSPCRRAALRRGRRSRPARRRRTEAWSRSRPGRRCRRGLWSTSRRRQGARRGCRGRASRGGGGGVVVVVVAAVVVAGDGASTVGSVWVCVWPGGGGAVTGVVADAVVAVVVAAVVVVAVRVTRSTRTGTGLAAAFDATATRRGLVRSVVAGESPRRTVADGRRDVPGPAGARAPVPQR